jgi:hypothetical protein
MPDDFSYLDEHSHGLWIALDVVQVAFGSKGRPLSKRRALEYAKNEMWRTAPGQRPRQYAFEDVYRTYKTRRGSP